MIVVKVELHSAITKQVTLIGSAIIHNVGGTKERGNYKVAVGNKSKLGLTDIMANPQRVGEVNNYPRVSYNIWRLVIRALRSAFPEEN